MAHQEEREERRWRLRYAYERTTLGDYGPFWKGQLLTGPEGVPDEEVVVIPEQDAEQRETELGILLRRCRQYVDRARGPLARDPELLADIDAALKEKGKLG